ncbi:MAG: phosphatidate cytidylyltransferase [Deltaproteobacteria bacterium]|nr:phosphatidate cytidylyltransferase [Deltaproteobacteria bacterium]
MSNTAVRLLAVAPLIPLILWLMFSAPPWAFVLLVVFTATVASGELMAMIFPSRRAIRLYGVAVTVGLALGLRFLTAPLFLPSALVGLVLGSVVVSLATPEPIEGAATRAGWLVAGPIYVGGLLASLMLIHRLPHGGAWVMLTMLLAWLSDTGAYFAGKAFGRHKLYPLISPKKTVEGAVGGLLAAVGSAVGMHYTLLPELPVLHAVGLGVLAGALGQLGDLFASLLKRSTGVKDSGKILPGHGGILDRIDALLITGALTWLYTAWLLPHS